MQASQNGQRGSLHVELHPYHKRLVEAGRRNMDMKWSSQRVWNRLLMWLMHMGVQNGNEHSRRLTRARLGLGLCDVDVVALVVVVQANAVALGEAGVPAQCRF